MDIVLSAFIAVLPLVLLILGVLEDRALFILVGSIGMIVIGVLYLASPPSVYYVDSQFVEINATSDITYENITYSYAERPLDPNTNLFIGIMFSFFGLAGLYNIAYMMSEGRIGD